MKETSDLRPESGGSLFLRNKEVNEQRTLAPPCGRGRTCGQKKDGHVGSQHTGSGWPGGQQEKGFPGL